MAKLFYGKLSGYGAICLIFYIELEWGWGCWRDPGSLWFYRMRGNTPTILHRIGVGMGMLEGCWSTLVLSDAGQDAYHST